MTTRCIGCGSFSPCVPDDDRWYCIDCCPPRLLLHGPRVGESPRALAGVLGGMAAVTGKAPDGERLPAGALPWHWCYGNQPVHVQGAIYADTNEGAHLVQDISDYQAQRAVAQAALDAVAGDWTLVPEHVRNIVMQLNPAGQRRRKMRRRVA